MGHVLMDKPSAPDVHLKQRQQAKGCKVKRKQRRLQSSLPTMHAAMLLASRQTVPCKNMLKFMQSALVCWS
eukprot:6485010-Amphidinium_carterae.1